MAKVNVNTETGEIESGFAVVEIENTLPITVSETEVKQFYFEPQKIIDLISEKAGSPVFDISTKKGRDECKSHAFKIIKCITPINEISKREAADAKKIVNQDVNFRNIVEAGIRKLAAIHRQPLTEWDEEQAAIKAESERVEDERIAELERLEELRLAEAKFLKDWNDALQMDELFDLRKEKEIADREAKRIADEKAEAERIEAEVQRRLEEKTKIDEENKNKRIAEAAKEAITATENLVIGLADELEVHIKNGKIKLSDEEVKKFRDSLPEHLKQKKPLTAAELREKAANCRLRGAHADKAEYARQDYANADEYDALANQLEAKGKAESTPLELTTEIEAIIAEAVEQYHDDYEEYKDFESLADEKIESIPGQPSNDEIINAVAFYFEVEPKTAVSWLKNMELEA